jgi:hypothetical protein
MSEDKKEWDLSNPPEATAEPEEEAEEKQIEEEPPTSDKALFAFEGAPDKEQINKWKEQYGEVLVSGFSQTELYVFRPLTRAEFVNLQAHIAQSQEQVSTFEVEEKICEACTLWASPPALESLQTKAGSLSTLHEQIMQSSNFVDPRFAASFVVRL